MLCTFMQSTFIILESFSLIDMFVYSSIEICVVVDYQNRLEDAFLLVENNIIGIGTFFIYSVLMCLVCSICISCNDNVL